MGEGSKIEWCDHTFNPWTGCTKVSPACDNCYAETWAKRTGSPQLWNGERRRTSSTNWQAPVKWNRVAQRDGTRAKVFCASLADVFDNQVPERWRDDLWHRIDQTPHLDWLLLTKRPQNIAKMLPDPRTGTPEWGNGWPNVWLGTTVENQEEADRRIPHLLAVPAAKRFLSCEPLLGPVDLTAKAWRDCYIEECGGAGKEFVPLINDIDWVITGGESGPGARPMHPDWARSLRDQCQAAGVPFFFKQWGEWAPIPRRSDLPGNPAMVRAGDCLISLEGQSHVLSGDLGSPLEGEGSAAMRRVGKKSAGAMIDGREWREMPT